jgi:hypothetical protein
VYFIGFYVNLGATPSKLPEEQITNEYRSDDTCCIGYQATRHGMACFGNTHTTEIYSQDIEGSICRALENASQSAYE